MYAQRADILDQSLLPVDAQEAFLYLHFDVRVKQRAIPLNAEARQAVRDWLAVRPQSESDYLWVGVEGDGGDGLTGRSVQRMLQRYAQDAGLADLTPHVLRHTFAKNLVNKGVGLEKVASLLGHSSLNTTRIYVVPDERDLELAVETLEN
jgi:site-specific recombinase XerD